LNETLQRVAARLEGALPAYLDDLGTLVGIDSGTFDKSGVDAVTGVLVDRYDRMGAELTWHPHEEYGDMVVARLRGDGPGRVLLIGHTDTVYPAGTATQRPFRREGDRAFGPGAADMKSGDLSIVYALESLLALAPETLGSITVFHNSDEEIGSPASKALVRELSVDADAVLVLEAGRESGDIVSARKGVADGHLVVEGVAAHAGVNPERGRNAMLELAHLIVRMQGLNGKIPGVTLNVGHVLAGERSNVVPDRALARFEMRAFERDRLEEAVARVREMVDERTVPDTRAALTLTINHWPMQKTEESARLVRLAQDLGGELGLTLNDVATGGASDGNTAAEAGRPVLDGLGPVGGGAHSPNEYIVLSSIVPRTALLAGLIAAVSQNRYGKL
jgi:glutamate carboxypeptidase